MKTIPTALCLAVALVAACDKPATVETTAPSAAPSPALSAVLDAATSGDPRAIHVVRESVNPGDAVTISGRVMGNLKPFVEGRAAFILGDPALLTACSDIPGDGCETPWDNCCDSPEDKKRGIATIRIVDADGRVLKEDIKGVAGIEKLASLTVTGTVAKESTADSLIIDASAIDPAATSSDVRK